MNFRRIHSLLLMSALPLTACVSSTETLPVPPTTRDNQEILWISPSPRTSPTRTPTPKPTLTPTPTPTTSTPPPSSGSLTGSAALDNEEWAFVTLINDYRAQNGVPKLEVSITLTQASDWLSVDMTTQNYFSHTDSQGRDPFTRMADFGYKGANSSGENIAAGNASAQDTFTQWKNSSGHNANMLSSNYRVIGVARANKSGSTYGWYWTTDFGSTVDATVQ